MSKLTIANLKKTVYYLKRNGLRDTYLAALERLQQKESQDYVYRALPEEELMRQRKQASRGKYSFSILVPAYRTEESYLRAMLESVLAQTYPGFELIIADASEDDRVEKVVGAYQDERIKYMHLEENRGISENTNAALEAAAGEYIGLLDHDDLLTPDALFAMAEALKEAEEQGITLQLLYSDEDKCDESGEYYYEPHRKTGFNLDLLLSNHYICHFMVMKAELMKALQFRREYDGAQDFDITLRAVGALFARKAGQACPAPEKGTKGEAQLFPKEAEETICHVSKVLYHWRCHRGSTAENPQSKQYAYEAGGRAIADFLKTNGLNVRVVPTKHLGFYRVEYEADLLAVRPDVGAVGGCLYGRNNKITGGIYEESGQCPYEGLRKGFSGYMHRASLRQDAAAVDIRLMKLRPSLLEAAREAFEDSHLQSGAVTLAEDGTLDCSALELTEEAYRQLSIRLCRKIRELGYRIVWDPSWKIKIK